MPVMETELAVGATLAPYVNNALAALVPPAVVTSTLAVPALPEGVVQVAVVALVTLKALHAVPPTEIPVAPVRLVPVIVIGVPPAVEPEFGEIAVTVGAAASRSVMLGKTSALSTALLTLVADLNTVNAIVPVVGPFVMKELNVMTMTLPAATVYERLCSH